MRGVGRSLKEGLGLGFEIGESDDSDKNEREVRGFRVQRWVTNPHS